MLNRTRSALAIAGAMLAFLVPCHGDAGAQEDGRLKERFMREYPRALERLRSSYSHIRGSGIEMNEVNRSTGAQARSAEAKDSPPWTRRATKQFSFQVEQDAVRLSRQDVSEGKSVEKPKEEVRIRNGDYSFRAEKPKVDSDFALKTIKNRQQTEDRNGLNLFRIKYLMAPFAAYGGAIDEFLWDSRVTKIGQVLPVVKSGRSLVSVEYTREIVLHRKPCTAECRILLAPEEGWTVQEQETKAPGLSVQTLVEYEPVSNKGIPAMKRVTVTSGRLRDVLDFHEFVFDSSPSIDFTLRSVGLPEIPVPRRASEKRSFAFWFFVIGNVLALLAIASYFARRNRARSSASH